MLLTVSLGSLLALIVLGIPIGFALVTAATLGLLFFSSTPPQILALQTFSNLNSFPLLAVPLFILGGNLLLRTGLAQSLIESAEAWVGHLRGGLAIGAVLASIFFAAITGSSAAEAAAVGTVLLPSMKQVGYPVRFSGALIAASGGLGLLIPPSLTMILFGSLAQFPVGTLFIAGIVPGVLSGVVLAFFAAFLARRMGLGSGESFRWRRALKSLRKAAPALFIPVLVIGGIYGGYFTPTEVAVVVVFYAVAVGIIQRKLTFPLLYKVLAESLRTTTMIFTLFIGSKLLGLVLTQGQVPQHLLNLLLSHGVSKWHFLLMLNVALLVMGMFVDGLSLLLISLPLVLPLAQHFGISLAHLAVIMTMNIEIGVLTPPVGLNLYVVSSIADVSMESLSRALLPFWLLLLGLLLVFTYIPALSLVLVH